MSDYNDDKPIRLDSPGDWEDWEIAFQTLTVGSDIWDYIDPENGNWEWPVRPKKPKIADYQEGATVVGDLDATNQKWYVNAAAQYRTDFQMYSGVQKAVQEARRWVQDSVRRDIFLNKCPPMDNLTTWYRNLKAWGEPYAAETYEAALRRYNAVVSKPLKATTTRSEFEAWATSWEAAVNNARRHHVPITALAIIWTKTLSNCLDQVLPHWSSTLLTVHADAVNDNTLTVDAVTQMLWRFAKTLPDKKRNVARGGAFATFGGDTDNDDDEEEPARGRDKKGGAKKEDTIRDTSGKTRGSGKSRGSRGGSSKTGPQKRPATGGDKGSKKKIKDEESSGSQICRGCYMRGHGLEDCYYVFPETAPDWWSPQEHVQRMVTSCAKALEKEVSEIKKKRAAKKDQD